MTQEEKNIKLAELVGFEFIKRSPELPDLWMLPGEIYPGGKCVFTLPNFFQSIDAILKWVVPKLPQDMQFSVSKNGDRPTWYARLQGYYFDSKQYVGSSNKSAPMAICDLLEKYIDAQKE